MTLTRSPLPVTEFELQATRHTQQYQQPIPQLEESPFFSQFYTLLRSTGLLDSLRSTRAEKGTRD